VIYVFHLFKISNNNNKRNFLSGWALGLAIIIPQQWPIHLLVVTSPALEIKKWLTLQVNKWFLAEFNPTLSERDTERGKERKIEQKREKRSTNWKLKSIELRNVMWIISMWRFSLNEKQKIINSQYFYHKWKIFSLFFRMN